MSEIKSAVELAMEKALKPDIPRSLLRALESGKEKRVVKALNQAFKNGYEPEYLAQKLGIPKEDIQAAMGAR